MRLKKKKALRSLSGTENSALPPSLPFIRTTARSAIRGTALRFVAGMLGKRNDRRRRRIPTLTGSLKKALHDHIFPQTHLLDWDYYTAADEENQVKSRKTLQKI